jgi:hypothetical protein
MTLLFCTRLIWHRPCQMKFLAWVNLTESPVCYARKFHLKSIAMEIVCKKSIRLLMVNLLFFFSSSCRKYQTIFDNCVEEQIGLTRPDIMHFMKIRLHKTNRPKPEEPELPAPLADPDLNREPSNPHYRRYGFSK